MAKVNFAFSNFTAGELSPRLGGRTDLSKYYNGCNVLENFLVHPHGGASRRPGTRYVADCKSHTAKSRLITFQFNTEQAYVLEFFNNGFRIYKDGGQVTTGSPAAAVEVTTTYTTAQLAALKFAQSADVMYVVHPDHPIRKISRTSHVAWTLTEVSLARGPFLDPNTTTTTMTANGRTGSSITITASAVTGVNNGAGFTSGVDVGRLIKLHHGFAKITAVASTTECTATAQENENFIAELEPAYTAATIAFVEGDPSSTGLEHNDRVTDSAKNFVEEGFLVGMTVTTTGASNSANNADRLLVAVTEDTMLFAPSDDVVAESASASITIAGKLVADANWELGSFFPGNFPSSVAFYEQRFVVAGTASQPQTVFFSVGGDFENFTGGTDADSALTYTIGSNQVNVIRYLSSSRSLLVGTSGGEFAVRSSGTDEPLTPTNSQIKQQSTYGSADVQPVQVGNAVLFLHRAARKIRELTYNFDSDSYVAPDLTILSEHVTEGGIVEMAYQQEPDNIVWCVRNDGILAGMTYRREEQVIAWHRHKIGGVSGTCTITLTDFANIAAGIKVELTKSDGSTVTFTSTTGTAGTLEFKTETSNNASAANLRAAINNHADFTASVASNVVTIFETTRAGIGFLSVKTTDDVRLATTDESHSLVESVATIPGVNEDQVWVVVQRTINGATKRYIEYMSGWEFGTDIEDSFFVDSGLTYTGSSATTLSGLNHLETENVSVLTNGASHNPKVVSSGGISLDVATTKAHVGLPFASTLQTMRLEAGATDGTAQGKVKRIDESTVRLFRTVNAMVGGDLTTLDRISFRSAADSMDVAVPLFTGDKSIEMPTGFDQDGFVVVQQDLPLPMTLISVIARAQTFD